MNSFFYKTDDGNMMGALPINDIDNNHGIPIGLINNVYSNDQQSGGGSNNNSTENEKENIQVIDNTIYDKLLTLVSPIYSKKKQTIKNNKKKL
jgi:hypothetical protein